MFKQDILLGKLNYADINKVNNIDNIKELWEINFKPDNNIRLFLHSKDKDSYTLYDVHVDNFINKITSFHVDIYKERYIDLISIEANLNLCKSNLYRNLFVLLNLGKQEIEIPKGLEVLKSNDKGGILVKTKTQDYSLNLLTSNEIEKIVNNINRILNKSGFNLVKPTIKDTQIYTTHLKIICEISV